MDYTSSSLSCLFSDFQWLPNSLRDCLRFAWAVLIEHWGRSSKETRTSIFSLPERFSICRQFLVTDVSKLFETDLSNFQCKIRIRSVSPDLTLIAKKSPNTSKAVCPYINCCRMQSFGDWRAYVKHPQLVGRKIEHPLGRFYSDKFWIKDCSQSRPVTGLFNKTLLRAASRIITSC